MRRHHGLWQPLERYLRGACRKNLILLDSDLYSFLRSNEWQHLHLSSMFVPQVHEAAKKQQLFSAELWGRKAFVYHTQTEAEALLLWTKHECLLFDCRRLRESGRGASRLEDVLPYVPLQELKYLLRKHTMRQFIGTRRHYDFLQSYYDFPFELREYWIMVRKPTLPMMYLRQHSRSQTNRSSASTVPIGLAPGMRLLRLNAGHFRQLLTLEQAYYAEEVIRRDIDNSLRRALEKQCAKCLKQFLQYGIFAGEELVARAMINTYGLYYWQIGGIYTTPRWRSQGLAHILLQRLCQAIEQAGRLAMLFVRVENDTAMGLYDKNGFERLEHLIIAQDSIG